MVIGQLFIANRDFLSSDCVGYLANTIDMTKEEKPRPEVVPIVWDFIEVFPEELPRLPPHREITFEIETVPGTAPISKAPYHIALVELKGLQTQQ